MLSNLEESKFVDPSLMRRKSPRVSGLYGWQLEITLVKMIDKPAFDADDDPAAGGTLQEIVTEYQRNRDGRLESQRTIRGQMDGDAPVPVEEKDAVQLERR